MLDVTHVFQEKVFAVFLLAVSPLSHRCFGKTPRSPQQSSVSPAVSPSPRRSTTVTLFTGQTPPCDGSWVLSHELHWE